MRNRYFGIIKALTIIAILYLPLSLSHCFANPLYLITQLTDNSYADQIDQGSNLINKNGAVVWFAAVTGIPAWDQMGWEIFLYDGTTTRRLTDNGIGDRHPSVNDRGDVVWQSYDGNNWAIHLYDATSQTTTEISGNTHPTGFPPKLNNSGYVVWEGHDGNDTEVFLYDGVTTWQLTDNDKDDSFPRINNTGHVTWFGEGEIFVFDGLVTEQLTHDNLADSYPMINDRGDIVWFADDGNDKEIFFYDHRTRTITQVTDNDYDDWYPRINGRGDIVWFAGVNFGGAYQESDYEIFVYEASSRTTTRITNDSWQDWRPYINSDGDVVWMKGSENGFEIFLYDAGTGDTVRVTDNLYNDYDPQINDNGDLVWCGFDGNDFEIYFARLAIIKVEIDIKPGSCPNPLNFKSRGVLPIAILGAEDFDVYEIDPASIRLAGVAPLRSAYEDVATPFHLHADKADCSDCTDEGPDGWTDLTLKFDTQEVVNAIGDVSDGDCLVLTATGNLLEEFGGTTIEGEDILLIKKKGKK
ncbi:MAG: hypothetical protein JRJ29_15040 [Deltaproteobacteria bacterium]|nr:hypothetical protein [Deltaproteobacteria bacterium]